VIEYEKWLKDFRLSHAGKTAMRNLQDIKKYGTDKGFDRLTKEVTLACFYASKFQRDLDEYEKRRNKITSFDKELSVQINLIEKLSDSIKNNSFAINRAILQNSRHVETSNSFLASEVLDYLNDYKNIISYPLPKDEKINFHECHMFGNFKYKNTIDKNDKKRPDTSTMLMFELAFYFRMWTHPESKYFDDFDYKFRCYAFHPSQGVEMPKFGKALYALIADFIKATFYKKTSTSRNEAVINNDTVKYRIRDVKEGTKLIEWLFEEDWRKNNKSLGEVI